LILIVTLLGAKDRISFSMRAFIPWNIVLPPLSIILEYKSFLMSCSQFMILVKTCSWIPASSLPIRCGEKRASGTLNLSIPRLIVL